MKKNGFRKSGSFLTVPTTLFMMPLLVMVFVGGAFLPAVSWAAPPATLQGVPVPEPPDLATYVKDKAAAIRLGKALFWDMQVGSDGIQACASCHFQAGGDIRRKNQLDPGLLANDFTYQFGGANFTLAAGHFPTTTNDPVGSQGVFRRNFNDVVPGNAVDDCTTIPDPNGFSVGGINVRRVPPRNTPPAVNAVFNFDNFWDGRADHVFNGATPRGAGAADTPIFQVIGGVPTPVTIAISNASLASQATGPARSDVEMSCAGRTWPDIGKKMLSLGPLAKQKVSPTDSVLGAIAGATTGLALPYSDLIQQAFVNTWWESPTTVTVGTKTFTVMEANFSLFWGLAIQLYEATLVSDQTPFDRFDAGDNTALNAQQQRGLNIFSGKGGCSSSNCHVGFLFSSASEPDITKSFRHIGVRPISDDPGAGPIFGDIDITRFNGAFKVPALRNVELNGPYFHNGGKATLAQLIEFYDNGGDFANTEIKPLNLTADEKLDLEAFLKALTDERVRQEQAPFDHPQIFLPNGEKGNNSTLACIDGLNACDDLLELPAVGAGGRPAAGLPLLQAFLAGPLGNPGPGDCNGNGSVEINEVQQVVNEFLGISTQQPLCGDVNGNGLVPINEIQTIINSYLGV